jgi:hypothetical protein
MRTDIQEDSCILGYSGVESTDVSDERVASISMFED